MNIISQNLGVQSWCFRHFKDNSTVAKKARAIGFDKIELCGVHADFNDPSTFGEAVRVYADAGIEIVSLGVQTFVGNDGEKAWFECAAAAGAKHISAHFTVSTYMAAIPKIREWSREFGVRVGLHCHGGYMFGGSLDVLDYLTRLGGPEIGVCIDTAWAMQSGGDPVKWVYSLGKRVTGVHFKDFVFGPKGGWEDVVVGTGSLDLKAFSRALLESGFDGMAVIEYEGDVENPDAALNSCYDSMKKTFESL